MHTQNNLGIWVSSQKELEKVAKVLEHFKDLDDVFIISDAGIHSYEYAVIPSYYVTFQDIHMAFLNLEDFVCNKNNVRSNSIFLFCASSEIIESKLDKNIFNNVKVIEI